MMLLQYLNRFLQLLQSLPQRFKVAIAAFKEYKPKEPDLFYLAYKELIKGYDIYENIEIMDYPDKSFIYFKNPFRIKASNLKNIPEVLNPQPLMYLC